jgi:putative aldouronate transport system substrate-binding protein
MKKFLMICVAFLLMVGICFAGGGRQGTDSGNKNITIIFYGDKTDRMAQFMSSDFPAYLRQRGLNINVDFQVLSWAEYAGSQVELRYASGEDFGTMTDQGFMGRCISRGFLYDLTNLIDRYAPNVRREIEASSFDAFSFNGRNYALPLGNKPNSSEWFAVTVRQDLLEEVGMREIRTIEDLERFYTEGKRRHPEYFGFGDGGPTDTYGASRMVSRYISEKNMLFLNEVVFTDASANDDRLYSYFESPEFKNYAEIARRWNRMGIIDQQVISDGTIAGSKFDSGQAFFRNGNAGRAWESLGLIRNSVPGAKLRTYFMGDARGRPLVSRGTYSTAIQVSANARHPEAYLEIFNLLYADQQSYDFMTYGVRGVDYELDSSGKISSRRASQVFVPDWASNLASKWLRFENSIPDDVINDYRHWNDGAILQKDIGFIFNVEPVRVEYAQIQSVVNEYIPPIALGFVDYDAAYPDFLRRLKNAGIDRYMAEFQRQFSEFYRNRS